MPFACGSVLEAKLYGGCRRQLFGLWIIFLDNNLCWNVMSRVFFVYAFS